PIILIVASLAMRKRLMAVLTVLAIGCAAWLVFGELSGAYIPGTLGRSVPGDFYTVSLIIIMTAVMVRFVTESLFRANRRLQEELSERKLAEDRIQRQAARAEALAALSNLLTQATQDYQLVLDTVVHHCAEILGDGASVFLYSPDSEFLQLAAVYNSDPKAVEFFRAEVEANPVRVDEGAYAQVIQECQPILIESVPVENLINNPEYGRREYLKQLPLYSMLLAPLQVQGQLLGIIGMGRHTPGRNYTSNDLTFLHDIADRSALAILNAQMYEELEQELTERKRVEAKMQKLARTDTLTTLFNRREFEKRLERALVSTKERNLCHVLCYLDLDQFKIVNDTVGHAAGDELLKQISTLLSGMFRQRDTLARLGGDEFGLLLENCQLEHALVICEDILTRIREFSFVWEGKNFHVGVSIGVVPITAEKKDINQLLSQADIACYYAKDLGRDRVYVYHMEDSETAQRHSEILQASRMRDAILHDQFLLYCQPIAHLNGDHSGIDNYEVLLRMLNDENDLVLPGVFIPPAERYGLMPAIDRWVTRQTFSAISRHAIDKVQISINLSGNSLADENLLEYVLHQLGEFSILPNQICFEITETAAIQHLSKAQEFIREFRGRGGKIALDDFGSGFSSFHYLQSLPVDYIKIDGAFVSNMLANPGDKAIVEAITRIAHTLGIYVIAEHATDKETINRLREIGVEGVQGFGIGFPTPVDVAWSRK
ncbi:MAG: EAL domain-containing protein, partial [Anaerolineales bacterium]